MDKHDLFALRNLYFMLRDEETLNEHLTRYMKEVLGDVISKATPSDPFELKEPEDYSLEEDLLAISHIETLHEKENDNKVLTQTGLTTGQMIDLLQVGDEAKTETAEQTIVVRKLRSGAISIIQYGEGDQYIGQELVLNASVLSATWTMYRQLVSFFDAIKAHKEYQKTITYHHDDELTYTFTHELETGQFNQLSNDNLCLYELIEDKWTIDD